jgi:acyl-CoA reductase-like NAD-dependent aldehyde dehydrogenase
MSIKDEARAIIDQLPDDATWDDLIKELYRQHKIDIGLTEEEREKEILDETDLNAITGRLESAKAIPDDMRNTKEYKPGNATTLGMVGGVVAVLFAFVFPPISWMGAVAALIGGTIGLKKHEPRAWVPILLALVALIPDVIIFTGGAS